MSEREPDNGNLIKFIATTVETMRDQMATKEDLTQFATKGDVESLRGGVESLRGETSYIGGQVETIRSQMATKSDVARLEAKMEAEFAAVRGDIEQIHLRLDSIERAL